MRPTRKFYTWNLVGRSLVFLGLVWYVAAHPEQVWADLLAGPVRLTPLTGFWLLLMVAMVLRFFPSRRESLGCQKRFSARFKPTGRAPAPSEIRRADRGALWVLLVWLGGNALVLTLWRWLDIPPVYLLCLTGFYSVCDIICILFLCPFQLIWMKNRCCITCRIYDWDYPMMCTPLVVIPCFYTWSLVALAVVLALQWEIIYRRHPERFFESSNQSLRCAACQEHLCAYKRRLREKNQEKRLSE